MVAIANVIRLGFILFACSSSSLGVELCDTSNRNRVLEFRPRADSVVIDGIFSVRRQVEMRTQSGSVPVCVLDLPTGNRSIVESFHRYGLEQVQAFLFGIHLANLKVTGTTTFGYRIFDSCGQFPGQSNDCRMPNSFAAVLGPFWHLEKTNVGGIDSVYKRLSDDDTGTAQVGVVLSGLDEEPMSSRATSPSVVYLQQSCASQGLVAVDFLLRAGWQYVSVIGSSDFCGVASVERFFDRTDELKADCKLNVSYYFVGESDVDASSRHGIANVSENMKISQLVYSRVPDRLSHDVAMSEERVAVVLLTNRKDAYQVFRQLADQNVDPRRFVFFLGNFWGNPDAIERLDAALLKYLSVNSTGIVNVKLQQHQGGVERFRNYLSTLKPYSIYLSRWAREYWEGFYNCNVANRSCSESEIWPSAKRGVSRNDHTSRIIDGVLFVANYCQETNCSTNGTTQPHFDTTRFLPDFMSWTGNRVSYVPIVDATATTGEALEPLLWRYEFVGFSPTRNRSEFNFTLLGNWTRQRLSKSNVTTTMSVQTDELWKPFSPFVMENEFTTKNGYRSPSRALLVLPCVIFVLLVIVSFGLFFHKGMLPAILKVVYTDVVAILGCLAGLVFSVLVILDEIPGENCEDLRVDFAVSVVCTACFASIFISSMCHRCRFLNTWKETEESRCFFILRWLTPAALLLFILTIQIALSAHSCLIFDLVIDSTLDVDSTCAATRDHATFLAAYCYSTLVCILCAFCSLLPPGECHSYPFRYHTWFARISLIALSLLFLSLITSYLVVDMYSVRLGLLSMIAAFPALFVSIIGLAIFIHVRWCYVHFATNVPIIIELIDPLMARTADVFSNKYANTMRSSFTDEEARRATISRCFPFQLQDQDLINQVRPVFINPDRIAIGEYIGGGNFGQVFSGTLDGSTGVALKTLRGSFSAEELEDFLKEGLRMKDFDHPNVMQLIGIGYGKVAVNQDPDSIVDVMPVVVLPYMAMGDLKRYLIEGRPGRAVHSDYFPEPLLDRLEMALQIANGMDYLAFHRIVHRDLAARNCMVDAGRQVKVGDFGLARVVDGLYYKQKRPVCLPFMWMSIESLVDRKFSTSSDVWSYGITLWEIMTYGQRPYRGINSSDALVEFLVRGKRMSSPDHCPSKIYSLMASCWLTEIDERTSFSAISQELGEYISTSLGHDPSNRCHIPIESEMQEVVEIFSYSSTDADGQETRFNHHSNPRYIGIYKVPRPVERSITGEGRLSGVDEGNWWEATEMAARQEQGDLSREASPHYVNEDAAEDTDETNPHSIESGNGSGALNQEGCDYVNAPFDSLDGNATNDEPMSSTACRGSNSTLDDENGYVKQNVYPSTDVASHHSSISDNIPDEDGTFVGNIRDSGITSGGDTADKNASPEYVDTDQTVQHSIVDNDGEGCESIIASPPAYVNVVTVVGVDGRAESSC